MNLKNLVQCAVVALVALSACTPQNGSGPSAGGEKGPVLQGTVSGGGGNGCEGKAFEAYAEKITNLEEFRIYIAPILRRLRSTGNDVLVDYLEWAANTKTWYFVPCELEKLPKEQVGVAIQYEQLALHGEHGIYIHSTSYRSKERKLKDRAALLLHEIVMGAKLLSKQEPKLQCETLKGPSASSACGDKMLAEVLVSSTGGDPKSRLSLDAREHEAIRAMTVFLAQRNSDFSDGSIRATRKRMGFTFPWDVGLSEVSIDDAVKAIARSIMTGASYQATEESSKQYFSGKSARCAFELHQSESGYRSFELRFLTELKTSDAKYSERLREFGLENHAYGTMCARGLREIKSYDSEGRSAWSECQDHYVTWPKPFTQAEFSDENVEVRGVRISGQDFDEVTIYPAESDYKSKSEYNRLAVKKLLLTREDQPRVWSVRFEFKKEMIGTGSPGFNGNPSPRSEEKELLDDPESPPVDCRLLK